MNLNVLLKLAPLVTNSGAVLAKAKTLSKRQILGLVTLAAFAVSGVLAGQMGTDAALDLVVNAILGLVQ